MIINLPNFDDTPSLQEGEFQKLPAGGYVCIITGADVTTSKVSGLKQIVLDIDIVEGDFAGYYKNAKFKPRYYKAIVTKEGKLNPYFKGLLENIQASNSDFKASATLNTDSLIGKKIGMVFRDEEREYEGKIYTDAKPVIAKSVAEIRAGDFTVPPIKKIERTGNYSAADYQNATSIEDDNYPF